MPALADRRFCIYITTTGRDDDGFALLGWQSAWQNWLGLLIHTDDAKRYTLRMRFLFSCVSLSPGPPRAQVIGCPGTAWLLLCFLSAVIYFLFDLFIYTRCTAFPMLQSIIKQAGCLPFSFHPRKQRACMYILVLCIRNGTGYGAAAEIGKAEDNPIIIDMISCFGHRHQEWFAWFQERRSGSAYHVCSLSVIVVLQKISSPHVQFIIKSRTSGPLLEQICIGPLHKK